MIMSQLGSGLFLIGLSMLYDVTGHLLMSPAKAAVAAIEAAGSYEIPMLVILAVISVGLAIKSGLYPFHYWIPDTYGYATPTASAVLSGLVSKGYIFLLIKIFYRVLGRENVVASRIVNVLFVFGLAGMLMGSLHAILEKDTRRMIAYSSVAQIGYIYMWESALERKPGWWLPCSTCLPIQRQRRCCLSVRWASMRCRVIKRTTRACVEAGYRNPWPESDFPWEHSPWSGFPCWPASYPSCCLPRRYPESE